MRELFVYYRIDVADAAAVRARVDDFQAALRAAYPTLLARFLVRPEPQDGRQTCMETYAAEPGGVGGEWQDAIEAAANTLAPLLRSPRHVEVFEDCR